MKQSIAVLLIFGILLQQATSVLILVNYEVNKELIAKTLCEKKDVPQSNCHGKCHLKKQLDKEEKREKSPQSFSERFEFLKVSDYENVFDMITGMVLSTVKQHYIDLISSPHLKKIYHPPSAGLTV